MSLARPPPLLLIARSSSLNRWFGKDRRCRWFVRAAVCVCPGAVPLSAISGPSQASIRTPPSGREHEWPVASDRCCFDEPPRGLPACSRPGHAGLSKHLAVSAAAAASPRRAAPRPTRRLRRGSSTCGPPGRCSSLASALRRLVVVHLDTDAGVTAGFRNPRASSTRVGGPRDSRLLSCCHNTGLRACCWQPPFRHRAGARPRSPGALLPAQSGCASRKVASNSSFGILRGRERGRDG